MLGGFPAPAGPRIAPFEWPPEPECGGGQCSGVFLYHGKGASVGGAGGGGGCSSVCCLYGWTVICHDNPPNV
eukprot:8345048-Lingulodinium_polyedra.AAC.1